jgi:acyl dehydratase
MSKEPRELVYDDIKIGDGASFDVTVTEELVQKFADVSGDNNPLHMDAGYASQTPFHERVVHGMLVGSFFSRLVGMYLPGKYALYLSQTMSFRRSIPIGTTIKIRGTVSHKTDSAKTIAISVAAEDAEANPLVSGEALVKLLK